MNTTRRSALPRLLPRQLSPATYRRVTLLAVWALGFIIVTGGAVRVTGSGLGCPDWPTCASHRVVAPWQYHAMVEFGNRIVTGLVCIGVALAVLGSRVRVPRRRDLTVLSWGLVAGVVGQIVLGGEAVKHELAPPFIMGHFLLSMLLLWDAVVLHHRASQPDDLREGDGQARVTGPARPLVAHEHIVMARLLAVAAGLVIVLGTIVTSSGPHGGDPKAQRLPYALHDVARLHGSAVMLLLGLTVVTLWSMVRSGAPAAVIRRGETLLVVLIAQGLLGYLQYFTGVPAALVAIHIGLAATVWAVTIRFYLGLTTRPEAAPTEGSVVRSQPARTAALAPS